MFSRTCVILYTFVILHFCFSVHQLPVSAKSSSVQSPPIIRTSTGDVIGFTRKVKLHGGEKVTVNTFLGVPYAKPPTGPLRFRPPVPVTPWNGTRAANILPNSCWQSIDESFDQIWGNFCIY